MYHAQFEAIWFRIELIFSKSFPDTIKSQSHIGELSHGNPDLLRCPESQEITHPFEIEENTYIVFR